jgi:hypothetical protein
LASEGCYPQKEVLFVEFSYVHRKTQLAGKTSDFFTFTCKETAHRSLKEVPVSKYLFGMRCFALWIVLTSGKIPLGHVDE